MKRYCIADWIGVAGLLIGVALIATPCMAQGGHGGTAGGGNGNGGGSTGGDTGGGGSGGGTGGAIPVIHVTEPSSSSLPNGLAGTAYASVKLDAVDLAGIVKSFKWSVSDSTVDSLPEGLVLSSDGVLSGIPSANSSGIYDISFTAEDATGTYREYGTRGYDLFIDVNPMSLSVGPSLDLVAGEHFSLQLDVSGTANPPFEFGVVGELPDGLSLDKFTGLMDGVPTCAALNASPASLAIRVIDSSSPPQQLIHDLTVNVHPGNSVSKVAVTTLALSDAVESVPYEHYVYAKDGTAPYTWTAVGLPPGLLLERGTLGWKISGIPRNGTTGIHTCTLTVHDSCPALPGQSSATMVLSVRESGQRPPVRMVTNYLPEASAGGSYFAPLVAIDGAPPYLWKAKGLPQGFALQFSQFSGWGITGTPTSESEGMYVVDLEVQDSSTEPERVSHVLNLLVHESRTQDDTDSISLSTSPPLLVGQDAACSLIRSSDEMNFYFGAAAIVVLTLGALLCVHHTRRHSIYSS